MRVDARTARARAKILMVAEELFAIRGWDSVSLREIARKCGMKNSTVVQYHFGSRENLIEEIADFRMNQMEVWRKSYIDDLDEADRYNVETILRCLFSPIIDIETKGRRFYSHFLLQYLLHKRIFMLNIYATDGMRRPAPQLSRAQDLLFAALPKLTRDEVVRRLVMVTIMILGNVVMHDSNEGQPWVQDITSIKSRLIQDGARFMQQDVADDVD